MRKLILIGLGIYGLAAVWRAEEKEDGLLVALSPFVAAVAIAMLTRRDSTDALDSIAADYARSTFRFSSVNPRSR